MLISVKRKKKYITVNVKIIPKFHCTNLTLCLNYSNNITFNLNFYLPLCKELYYHVPPCGKQEI